MTGGERIYAALTTAPGTDAGRKVRQDAADEDDKYPFIIFRRVDVFRDRALDGTLLATKETFHVECWGDDRAMSDVLEQQALDRLQAVGLYSDGNDVDGIDPEVRVRSAVFLLDIWTPASL